MYRLIHPEHPFLLPRLVSMGSDRQGTLTVPSHGASEGRALGRITHHP